MFARIRDSFRGHTLRSWLALQRHNLAGGEFVALIEIVRSGESFGLVRSPTFRWFWEARLWVAIVTYCERDAERLVRKIVPEAWQADAYEKGYADWAARGMKQEKFSTRLTEWASHKRSA